MKRDIKVRWFYNHAPQEVWECLTEIELLKQWTKITQFELKVGFEFTQKQVPRPALKWDGMMYHKILEIVPGKKLVYTFRGGPQPGVITLDTVVTWTLIPKDNGTELILEQTGFEGAKNIFSSFIMEMGWKKILGKRIVKVLQQNYGSK